MGKHMSKDTKDAMFADYLAGMTYKEMSEKYGYHINTIFNTVTKNNWKSQKIKNEEARIDTLRVKYINAGDEIIERHYRLACKLLDQLEEDIENPQVLLSKDGIRSPYKVGAFIDNYMKLVQQMNQLTGGMNIKDVYELKLKHEALEIKRLEHGLSENEEVKDDNFMEALGSMVEEIGIGEEDNAK